MGESSDKTGVLDSIRTINVLLLAALVCGIVTCTMVSARAARDDEQTELIRQLISLNVSPRVTRWTDQQGATWTTITTQEPGETRMEMKIRHDAEVEDDMNRHRPIGGR